MTNTKTRMTIGQFKIESSGVSFTVNLADVINKIQPFISKTPDEVKPTLEITFHPISIGYRSYNLLEYDGIDVTITREMTTEEYAKASDAPSKASAISLIKTCFDSSNWTGRK